MKQKILLVLTILFGLMMVNSGLNKLFNYMPMPELTPEQMTIFGAFGTIEWVLPLIAIGEILGGILIAIPKYRALGAIVIFPIMVGIIVHHMTHDPATLLIPLILLAINLWVIIDNRAKYLPMVK
ncbi:DoxX family protein [Parapedobacter tibetensis]|uniref:DoxX family protein n=1 Tax=Parapedobacter tibetensis TaxID=2972951 RepID=UPI00214DADB1|nr:DoxX family protein [Parapedobacter tibetensis]